MHHEKDISDEMREFLESLLDEGPRLGPTGRFPDGKLTKNDEGELAFAVGTLKGKVVINFGTPIASVGMSAKQARQLASILRKRADEISPGRQRGKRRRRRR